MDITWDGKKLTHRTEVTHPHLDSRAEANVSEMQHIKIVFVWGDAVAVGVLLCPASPALGCAEPAASPLESWRRTDTSCELQVQR